MSYDAWLSTEPEDYEFDPCDNYSYINEVKKYDEVPGYLQEIFKHIYVTGDVDMLEDSINELSSIFYLRPPSSMPRIQKIEERESTLRSIK